MPVLRILGQLETPIVDGQAIPIFGPGVMNVETKISRRLFPRSSVTGIDYVYILSWTAQSYINLSDFKGEQCLPTCHLNKKSWVTSTR